MKKSVLFIGSILLAGLVQAQITFGVHADGIMANLNSSYYDGSKWIKEGTKIRLSWKAGVLANIPLSANFGFMPQLNLLSKGSKVDDVSTNTAGGVVLNIVTKGELKLTEIELPLYVTYGASNKDGGIFGAIGPVLSYGIGGSFTYTGAVNGGDPETQAGDIIFDGKKDVNNVKELHLKSIEFGGALLLGYKLKSGLFFNAHYNLGFTNITPDTDSKLKTNYAGVGIGYFFNQKQK